MTERLDVVLVADGGDITVGRKITSYVYGALNVILPDGVNQQPQDERLQDGYIYRPPDMTDGLFDVEFVRADVTIDMQLQKSNFERTVDNAQKRLAGDVFFERDIPVTGLGAYRPGIDFFVGDVVSVEVAGKRIPSLVTAADESGAVGEGAHVDRVHVGGQLITDVQSLGDQTDSVLQRIAQERKERLQSVGQVAENSRKAVSDATDAKRVAEATADTVSTFETRISDAQDSVAEALKAVAEMSTKLEEGVDTTEFDRLMGEHRQAMDTLKGSMSTLDGDLSNLQDKLGAVALRSGMVQAGNLVWNPHAKENMAGWYFTPPLVGAYFESGGVTAERVRVRWNGAPMVGSIDFGWPDTQTYFPIAPEQEFLCSVWVRPTVQLPAGALRLDFEGASSVPSPPLPSGQWAKIEGVIKVNSNNAAKRSWLRLVHTTNIPDGAEWDVCNPSVIAMAGDLLLVDGAVTASKIAGETITGDKIAARTIMANRLQITAGNLFPDPNFKDPSWAEGNSNVRVSAANGGELQLHANGSHTGQYYWPVGGSQDRDITLEGGAAYRISMGCSASSTANQNICAVYMRYLRTDNKVGIRLLGNVESIGAHGRRSINFTTPTDMRDGLCTIGFFIQEAMTAGSISIWDVQLVRAADSLLIVDGAIQAQHVSAGSITTSHIAAAGISADVISGGSIDGKLIKAGTLTADRVNADEIYLKKDGSDNLKEQWDDFQFALAMLNNTITALADKVYKLQSKASGFYVSRRRVLTSSSDGQIHDRFRIILGDWVAQGSWRGTAWYLPETGAPTITRVDARNRKCGSAQNDSSIFYEVDPVDTLIVTLKPASHYDLPQSAWTTIPSMTYTAPANAEEVMWDGSITFTNVHRGSTYGVRILIDGKPHAQWTSSTFGALTSLGASTWRRNFSGSAPITGGQQIEVQAFCDDENAEKRRVTTATSVSATIYYTM